MFFSKTKKTEATLQTSKTMQIVMLMRLTIFTMVLYYFVFVTQNNLNFHQQLGSNRCGTTRCYSLVCHWLHNILVSGNSPDFHVSVNCCTDMPVNCLIIKDYHH